MPALHELAPYQQPQDAPISEQTIFQAIMLAETFTSHALAVFDMMGADAGADIARKAWKWIDTNKTPVFTARECWTHLRGSVKTMKEMETGYSVLVDHAYIEEIQNNAAAHRNAQKAGRPSRTFRVNPIIANDWGIK